LFRKLAGSLADVLPMVNVDEDERDRNIPSAYPIEKLKAIVLYAFEVLARSPSRWRS